MVEEYTDEGEQLGSPILLGKGNISNYMRAQSFACCNDLGIDLSQSQSALTTGPFRFYLDHEVGTAVGGANQGIFFSPGSMQLITFNEYEGSFNQEINGTVFGTMPDPLIPGLTYDIRIFGRDCVTETNGEGWDVKISLIYDVFTMPEDIYETGDRLKTAGGAVNGIFQANWLAV